MKLSIPYKIDLEAIKDHELPAVAAYFVIHLDAALFLKQVSQDKVEDDLHVKITNMQETIRKLEARLRGENGGIPVIVPPLPPKEDRPWKIFR
jgi:hypothetical protein